MRAAVLSVIGAVAFLVAGCRALIGYEEFGLDADGGRRDGAVDVDGGASGDATGGTSDGVTGTDAAATPDADVGIDATTPDAAPDVYVPPVDTCGTMVGGACFKCCRDTYGTAYSLLAQGGVGACYCASKGCDAECGSWCQNPQTPPPMACGQCVDGKLGTCTVAITACKNAVTCRDAAYCLEKCK